MGKFIYITFIGLYITMIIIISAISRRKISDANAYLLGGRSIPPWMSAFSYGTAYFSSVLFIGYAGKIGWNFGLSALWICIGNTVIGTYFAWEVLGKKTREMTNRLKASTMPEFLSIRYDSKNIKVLSAIIIFVFLLPYAAGVYKGLGFLFEQIFGIPQETIYMIMLILTAFYLFVGGFMATTLADFFQGIIMIMGAILLLFYVTKSNEVNGFIGVYENLKALPDIGTKLVSPIGPPGFLPIFSLVILTSFGSWGMPQMVHKFYTIKNENSIKTAKWVSTCFALLLTFSAYFTGAISRLILSNVKPESYDMIMPMVFDKTLPVIVSAVLLVLVLSASMSTLASIVLAASSAVAVDLAKSIKPSMKDKDTMLLLRILCVVFVIGSYLLANSGSSVLNLAAISWGAVSGSLLAPYLYGLFWKKANKAGAFAGMITALLVEIIGVIILDGGFTNPNIPVVGALAIILPMISVFVVSNLTQPHTEEHIEYIYNTLSTERSGL